MYPQRCVAAHCRDKREGLSIWGEGNAAECNRSHNEAAFRDLAKHWGDRKTFMAKLRGKIQEADSVLRHDGRVNTEVDAAWDNSTLREGMRSVIAAREMRADGETLPDKA